RSAAVGFAAEAKRATDAHVHRQRAGRLSEIARDDLIARVREIDAVASRGEGRAINIQRRKRRPLVVLAIEIRVLPGGDIKRRATVRDDERTENQFPPGRSDRADQSKSVT